MKLASSTIALTAALGWMALAAPLSAQEATEAETETTAEETAVEAEAEAGTEEADAAAEAEAETEMEAETEAETEMEAEAESAETEIEAEAGAEAETGTATASDEDATPAEDGIVEMVQGAEDAPVTVMEYASYTCPHCANWHETSYPQLKDYIDEGKVRFVYREVYFDRPGLWASMIARCGGEQKFFGISDMLYEQQRDWAAGGDPAAIAAKLREIGLKAGLEEAQLEACLTDGDKAQELVSWFEENAKADDITSTPTFLINGEKHSNMAWADMAEIIDGLIEE
ncbi:DsbA family protein [Limimaricola sp. AA108-03]|uniref:DsbA family protein n=1 Tax=Limimaricola sp. AA108-03 TaxID=3425945 RepID=UPI003D781595